MNRAYASRTDVAKTITRQLLAIRETAPLVLNVTNYVVMNYTANALLAVGASPVMAHAPEEMAELVGHEPRRGQRLLPSHARLRARGADRQARVVL